MLTWMTEKIKLAGLFRWLVCFGILLFLWAGLNFNRLKEYYQSRDRLQQLELRVARMQSRQGDLEGKIQDWTNNRFAVEKAVREELLLIAPGENIILMEPPELSRTPAMGESAEAGE